MSRIIKQLNKIFDGKYIVAASTIEEPDEGMRRELFKGNGIADEDILVCRLDQKNVNLFPYLRGDAMEHGLKGMKRICDYAIFVDKQGILYVLLIEMKKGNDSPHEQLDVTAPLIDFIFERAKILNHIPIAIYNIRKIGITERAGKRTTGMQGDVEYNDNKFVKLYGGQKLYLQRMLH